MMQKLITVLLIIVGTIHILPLSGVIGGARLASLYGMSFDEPNLAILMQHRAVLFGLLGVFIVYSAFNPPYQTLALIFGLVSVGSFLVIAVFVGGYNGAISRVVTVDVVALCCLLAVVGLRFWCSAQDVQGV
jgi:hypothetical protein